MKSRRQEFGPLAKAGNRSPGEGYVVNLLACSDEEIQALAGSGTERIGVPMPARGPYPAQPDFRPAVYGRFGNVLICSSSPLEAGFSTACKLEWM
jgi:hypothetical protein